MNGHGATVELYWQGKTEVLGKKPVSVPLSPQQNQNGLVWDWTRASAVRGRWLTPEAWHCQRSCKLLLVRVEDGWNGLRIVSFDVRVYWRDWSSELELFFKWWWMMNPFLSEMWGSHSDLGEDSSLLKCCAVSSDHYVPTFEESYSCIRLQHRAFQQNVRLLDRKSDSTKILLNVGNILPVDSV